MLTGKQAVALSELIHAVRPDWDVRGIQAELRRIDPEWTWPAICQHAITVAANASYRTPEPIAWTKPEAAKIPPCPRHGYTARRPDGTWPCCDPVADSDPPDYRRTGVTRPPVNFRAQVEAAKTGERQEGNR